jgi:hypothetical protein
VLAATASGCKHTSNANGTPVLTVSATLPGSYTSFAMPISVISLRRTDGQVYSPLTTYELPDFATLGDVSELLAAPAIPAGTYTAASISVGPPAIHLDVNGKSTLATLVDTSGNPISAGYAVTINFDSNHPLVINAGQSTRLDIELDLAGSTSVNLSGATPVVTLSPFMTATSTPSSTRTVRARGALLTASSGGGNFIVNTRPFLDESSALGALTVHTDGNTTYDINGHTYTGAAGLTALAALPQNVSVISYGTFGSLSTITPVFNASQVYAGTSQEASTVDHLRGFVVARSGDVITLQGATLGTRLGALAFYDTATMSVGDATVVNLDGQPGASGLNKLSVSVGQLIDAAGQASFDSNGILTAVDATQGEVRLQSTPAWGLLNSATAGSLALTLQSMGPYAVAGFDFTGTGTTSASDATPANYVVNTGSLDESGTAAGTLLRLDGGPTPFGSAPPAFTASAVTAGSANESLLQIEWINGGTTAPFVSSGSSGLVVNLADANLGTVHQILTGPATLDLTTLPASPTIVGDTASPIGFALGNQLTAIGVFGSFSSFVPQLTATLNGSNLVRKLTATGHYDPGSNTFTATRINVIIQ